ncbi:hypothetical protein BGZ60DRAFT_468168 [Tricladium varicosporioides]|nr:hypothetical protein BGZ60DRAFT_468168 [Hymenoscyphus varicosporioides]
MTLQNELWSDINTSPMTITLTDDWAHEHDIPISLFRFPQDPKLKGVYYLKAYHLLYCLKAIRKSVLNTEKGFPQNGTGNYKHILYCLDAIRQDIICNVDDTPMPIEIGDGQPRMCRSMDKLTEWSRGQAYHPRVNNEIEVYAFCEEGGGAE